MGYPDVSVNYAYEKSIEFVSTHGIMVGDENGKFNLKSHISVAMLCVVITHFFSIELLSQDYHSTPGIPDWASPYFSACQNAKLLPPNFAERINQDAEIKDIFHIFDNAKKHLFRLTFQMNFRIFEKFSENYLSRGICAHLIYLFAQYVSREVSRQLLTPDKTPLTHLLSLVDQYTWIPELASSDIYQICSLLKPTKYSTKLSEQVSKFVLMRNICNLKQKFSYQGNDPLYHYTSLYALEKLTLPNAQFHLSNTAYLNDPQEGLLGMNKLSKRSVLDPTTGKRWYASSKSSSDVTVRPSFIASFMTKGDILPMWVQYGSGGAGCCLEFSPDTISEPLYSVTYSSKVINAFFSKIFEILNSYRPSSPLSSDPVFRYARTVLDQGCYLYKDISYKHEQEVRIITFAPVYKAKSEDTPRPGDAFPRVYWETPLQKNRNLELGLRFSSIILGPTVPNPEQIAVALAQRGYDNLLLKKSKIKFR